MVQKQDKPYVDKGKEAQGDAAQNLTHAEMQDDLIHAQGVPQKKQGCQKQDIRYQSEPCTAMVRKNGNEDLGLFISRVWEESSSFLRTSPMTRRTESSVTGFSR